MVVCGLWLEELDPVVVAVPAEDPREEWEAEGELVNRVSTAAGKNAQYLEKPILPRTTCSVWG